MDDSIPKGAILLYPDRYLEEHGHLLHVARRAIQPGQMSLITFRLQQAAVAALVSFPKFQRLIRKYALGMDFFELRQHSAQPVKSGSVNSWRAGDQSAVSLGGIKQETTLEARAYPTALQAAYVEGCPQYDARAGFRNHPAAPAL